MNFIVQQAFGGVTKDLKSITEQKEADPEEEKRRQEHQEALAEQEAERKAKHAKFEAGRQSTRERIRKKHNLRTNEQKEQERLQNDPMAAMVANMNSESKVPGSMQQTEYEDNMMGQAQQIFDESKEKAEELKNQAMEYAPDQCKQQ